MFFNSKLKPLERVLFIFSVQKKIHTGLVLLFFPNNSKVNCNIEYQCANTLDEVWAPICPSVRARVWPHP